MKLEYKKMGLSEEQAERYAAARELLEKTLEKFKGKLGHTLAQHCPTCRLVYETLCMEAEGLLLGGSDAVTLRALTYSQLEKGISASIRRLESLLTEYTGSPMEAKMEAKQVVGDDRFVVPNMAPPSMKC